MARKELIIQIQEPGRDQGKAYFIREMPATKAEKWAMRAFLAIGRAGIDIPKDLADSGFAGIAKIALELICKLPFEDAEALMDEMFACVQAIPNPQNPGIVRPLVEDDIEEIATRIKLRVEVFKLHAGFSIAAA